MPWIDIFSTPLEQSSGADVIVCLAGSVVRREDSLNALDVFICHWITYGVVPGITHEQQELLRELVRRDDPALRPCLQCRSRIAEHRALEVAHREWQARMLDRLNAMVGQACSNIFLDVN